MVFLKHFKIELVNRNCMKSVKHKNFSKMHTSICPAIDEILHTHKPFMIVVSVYLWSCLLELQLLIIIFEIHRRGFKKNAHEFREM